MIRPTSPAARFGPETDASGQNASDIIRVYPAQVLNIKPDE